MIRKSDLPQEEPFVLQNTTTDDKASRPPAPFVEAVDPDIIEAVKRAVAPYKIGDLENALSLVKESISSHPLSGQLHYTEGKIHRCLAAKAKKDLAKVKHLEDGVHAAQLAVNLLPKSLHCCVLLQELLEDLAYFNNNGQRAEEEYDRGITLKNPIDFGVSHLFDDDEFNPDLVFEEKEIKEDNEVKNKIKELENDYGDIMKFWTTELTDEKKRGFSRMNIEHIENHLKSLKDQRAVDIFREAIEFAKKHKTWKFWLCYDCADKFFDYKLYLAHLREVHSMHLPTNWSPSEETWTESLRIITSGEWKPVNTSEVMKNLSLVNSRTESHKWPFCDDINRLELLKRIRWIFHLLIKNSCFASSHVHWVIEYTESQINLGVPLLQRLNLGKNALEIIFLLDELSLTEVLTFFEGVAQYGRLIENVEMPKFTDDDGKLRDHPAFDIKERVIFSKDFSCFLLDERVLRGELNSANYFNEVTYDGSAVSVSTKYCVSDVLSVADELVSWLYMAGFNCGECLVSWTNFRESQRSRAIKSRWKYNEKLIGLPTYGDETEKIPSKLDTIWKLENMFRTEIETKHEPQLFWDFLKMCQKECKDDDVISSVISEVLAKAPEVQSGEQSASKPGRTTHELTIQETEKRCKTAFKRLKMQLLQEMSLFDAVNLQKRVVLQLYIQELKSIAECDYRWIIVPILKSFLQSNLEDLYKDAKESQR